MVDSIVNLLHGVSPGGLGLVLHIGAGADAASDHATTDAARLVLVEGDPDAAEALRDRILRASLQADVREAVVAAASGLCNWHTFSLRRLNGTSDAAELRQYYARLTATGTRQVRCVAIQALVASMMVDMPDGGLPHALLLDVPNQAGALLAAIEPALLQRFHWIIVREPPPLPGGATKDGKALLTGLGFVRVEPSDAVPLDSPWPVAAYRLDEAFLREMALKRRATLAEDQLRHALQEQRELEQRELGLQRKLVETDAALADARKEVQRVREALVAGREARTAEVSTLHRALEELEASAAHARTENEAMRRRLDEQAARHAAELDALKAAGSQLDGAVARERGASTAELDALRAELGRLRDLLEAATRERELFARLQLVREGDLRDLQERYSVLRGQWRDQQDLLRRVAERLTAARQHFRRIEGDGPAPVEPRVLASGSKALAGAGSAPAPKASAARRAPAPRRGKA